MSKYPRIWILSSWGSIVDNFNQNLCLGWESMILMMLYGATNLDIQSYEAKIKMDNQASIKMFQKLKFEEVSKSDVFQEVTLAVDINDKFTDFLKQNVNFVVQEYQH